jgi:flavodoxin I
MQDDWAAMLGHFGELKPGCFAGKQVAIFGLGDFRGYPDTYVDAMGELWQAFEARGATLVGTWPTEDYEFTGSKGLVGDKFLGLVIDVENQDALTDNRVAAWAEQLKAEFPL